MEMVGFTYRGKHSYRDIGVRARTQSRPVAPPVRVTDETIPYRDGTIDYSAQNGRLYYDDKVLELELQAVDRDIVAMHKLVSKLAGWLVGDYAELVFDDMPNVIWLAKPVDISGITPELLGRKGTTTVQFRCRPYNQLMYDSLGIVLDDDIPLDANVELDYGIDSFQAFQGGATSFDFEYIGNAPVSPKITVEGTNVTSFSISCNGRTLSYSGAISSLVLDCEVWRAANGGTDVTDKVTGEYFELLPGTNTITVTSNGGGMVTLEFNANYLYGDVGFDD